MRECVVCSISRAEQVASYSMKLMAQQGDAYEWQERGKKKKRE